MINEILRLFPVASSFCGGELACYVEDPDGRPLSTDGYLIWAVSQPVHRDAAHGPKPDTFIPDRWSLAPRDPVYPVKDAWRPFEFGPRNCIGQELTMMEIKIAMRQSKGAPRNVKGERAYQLTFAGPSDDLPCKVNIVKGKH